MSNGAGLCPDLLDREKLFDRDGQKIPPPALSFGAAVGIMNLTEILRRSGATGGLHNGLSQ